MRQRSPWHGDWGDIDHTSDPAFFVRFLDASRRPPQPAMQQALRQFVASLDLEEGHRVLDAGCGTGECTRALASLVGETGRVVGVDRGAVMIAQARKRAEEQGSPVEFRTGDVCALAFPDASFDRCLATALFQHLDHPRRALAEMTRVARPGARIVVADHDWGTLAVDADDRAVTRKILDFFCDTVRDGWMGRRLPGLCHELGLEEIDVSGISLPLAYPLLEEWVVRRTVEDAQAAGVVSAEEVAGWCDDLARRAAHGRFFASVCVFRVSARKPAVPR